MAIVYIIADTLARRTEEGTETRIFQYAVCGVDDPDEAYEAFISQFEESKEAHEGWEMVGTPDKIDVDAEVYALWGTYITTADVVPFGKPQLVK